MSDKAYVENENHELAHRGIEFFVTNGGEYGRFTATAHIHAAIEILYITKGSFTVSINNKECVASEGDMVLIRPNAIHSISVNTEKPSRYYVLKIKSSFLLDFAESENGILYLMQLSLGSKKQKIIWSKSETKLCGCDKFWQKMICADNERLNTAELIIKATAMLIIAEILNTAVGESEKDIFEKISLSAQHQIYKAMVYVNNNFDKNISAKSCAEHVNMSYTHFSRIFKQITRKSFTQYLTQTRINYAEKEIVVSDKTITEIGYGCGFNDTSYFILKYKQLRGISPCQARKNLKK